jgi:uncharacterized protein GlcG (DUF336 family)
MVLPKRRPLRAESLEARHMMSGWHNTAIPSDVNNDSQVSPLDALVVVNTLQRSATTMIQLDSERGEGEASLDVNNDGRVTPNDALRVINTLARSLMPAAVPDLASFPAVISPADAAPGGLLAASEVTTLLNRASAVTPSEDAIIAVVDRAGRILGVRVEAGVDAALQADPVKLAFAIDGAVAKARTAAFFSSGAAPLTSRTIRFISQSTVTQREVESSPTAADPRYAGPGFVAPIGVGGNFPPEIPFTPQVDLLGIEHQSRDSKRHAGIDGLLGTGDDFVLTQRFNALSDAIPPEALPFFQTWPESYGVVTNSSPTSQSRGIATLPGGIPLFKSVAGFASPNLVGGIGVFFPGEDGFATFEQGFRHADDNGGVAQSEKQRTNAPKVLEAEYMALVAAAGEGILGPSAFRRDVSDLNAKLPELRNFVVLNSRIDLVGITLEIYGPTPSREFRVPGIDRLLAFGRGLTASIPVPSGVDLPVDTGGSTALGGQAVPEQWLVAPHDSPLPGGLKADEVERMIRAGIASATQTRAAIRLAADLGPGATTRMVLSVADTSGNILGLYRMPDATVFSIDVAVAKARNTAYYADPIDLIAADRVDFNGDGLFGEIATTLDSMGDTLPLGTALTNRTFRFLVGPRFPTGVEFAAPLGPLLPATPLCEQSVVACSLVGPQSGLRLPGINPLTAENLRNDDPLPRDIYADPGHASTLMFDAFVPSRNFRDLGDVDVTIDGTGTNQRLANQNGVVFFPGSAPLYTGDAGSRNLVGGLGVSGDGVDQDDVVTVASQAGFEPDFGDRVDQYTIGGVRLPYQKFNRHPS